MTTGDQKRRKRRSRNLDDATIGLILEIVDGINGSVTYAVLIREIELRLKTRYTRQALYSHERIRLALHAKRQASIGGGSGERRAGPRSIDRQRINRLESENARLRLENEVLIQKFLRWSYNAFTRGLTEDFLDQPLPPRSTR